MLATKPAAQSQPASTATLSKMPTSPNAPPRTTIRISFTAREHANLSRAAQAAYQSPDAFVNHAVAQYIDVRRSDRWEFDAEDWEPEAEFDLADHPTAPGVRIEVDFNSREMRQISAAGDIAGEPLHDFIDHALRTCISRTLAQYPNPGQEAQRDSPPPVALSVKFSSADHQALCNAARLDGMQPTEFVQIAVGAAIMTQRLQRLRASRLNEDWGPDANHEHGATAFTTMQVSRDGEQLDDLLATAQLADEDSISFIRRAVRERVVALLINAESS